MRSQTSSTPRVQTLINTKGDTVLQMSLADGKIILNEVLGKVYADSIIKVYELSETLTKKTITLQSAEINLLKEKFNNEKLIVENLNQIFLNKDKEIVDLTDIIKYQKKEIRKQKILKVTGFISAVILPITVLILMSR